jgi:hypothetical protein
MLSPSRFLRRGSYANVVATLALVVALGGTSYAAAQITTAQIKNGTIRTADLHGNAVKSGKVKNGSLKALDFAAGELPAGPQGPQGPQGDPGPQGPQGPSGSDAIPRIAFAPMAGAFATTNTAYVTIPALTVNASVPVGGGRLLATFSGETVCSGPTGYCTLRILVDGVEMNPVVGTDFAFDSTDNGNETVGSWEAHSIQRYTELLGAGPHTISVQVASTINPTTFRVDDALLTVVATQI